jgi:hypothetical protein
MGMDAADAAGNAQEEGVQIALEAEVKVELSFSIS